MSADDLERYETDLEMALYEEYRDVLPLFNYTVETERRFYLANGVETVVKNEDGRTYFELTLTDAWVWDLYRTAKFLSSVKVITFKDINIEEITAKGSIPDYLDEEQ